MGGKKQFLSRAVKYCALTMSARLRLNGISLKMPVHIQAAKKGG